MVFLDDFKYFLLIFTFIKVIGSLISCGPPQVNLQIFPLIQRAIKKNRKIDDLHVAVRNQKWQRKIKK